MQSPTLTSLDDALAAVLAQAQRLDGPESVDLFSADGRVLWVNEALIRMAAGLGTQDGITIQAALPPWLTPLEELWRDGAMVSLKAGPMSLLAQRLETVQRSEQMESPTEWMEALYARLHNQGSIAFEEDEEDDAWDD